MKLRPICNFTEILSEVKEDDDNIDQICIDVEEGQEEIIIGKVTTVG